MKPPISVSDQIMFEVTKRPIDTLGTFEQTSDSALERNITEQIEFIGVQMLLNANHPKWDVMREILVNDVVRAYIARKLIRVPEFKVHWLESYRIEDRPKGGAAIIYSGNGLQTCVEYQMRTGLLHAVGRHTMRQCPGVVEYKRDKYEMYPHFAHFKLARD